MQCQGEETSQSKELFEKRVEGQVANALKQLVTFQCKEKGTLEKEAVQIIELKNIVSAKGY